MTMLAYQARTAVVAAFLAAMPCTAAAQDSLPDEPADADFEFEAEDDDMMDDLMDLDLEALMDIEVTVVSRRAESLDTAPAAVYVLTGEEIRRAGHSSVQEALRMVPGVFVSHWESSEWDVTIRGFGPGVADANFAYLNQVLVMIDGVVVYTPLFAGMWWGLQDLDMEHIDRIEVIRGPSGILWGANAFHGLINIVTKDSADTQGLRASVRVSNNDNFVTIRASDRLNDEVTFSAFARRTRYDGLQTPSLDTPSDLEELASWGVNSGGIQFDGKPAEGRTWRLWGRGYSSNVGKYQQITPELFGSVLDRKQGGQAAFQWNDDTLGLGVRASYVKDRQDIQFAGHELDTDHLQFEAKHDFDLTERQRISWGVGYDYVHSNVSYYGGFFEGSFRQKNSRAFLSDTWRHETSGVSITAGIQAIDHEYSGFDLQPSVRFAWETKTWGSFWGSASRAIRTPTVEEELFGAGTLDNETVIAGEAGWRKSIGDDVSVDFAFYHNDYDDVRTRMFDPISQLDNYTNNSSGNARGAEIGVDIKATENWTLRTTYAFHKSVHFDAGSDGDVATVDDQYPRHIGSLRSYLDLGDRWELDLSGYLVDRFSGPINPEYWRGDARLGFRPNDHLRLSVGVQGFHDSLRREFGLEEVQRMFYFSVDLTR